MSPLPPTLYTLAKAAKLLAPDGGLTARSLRTEARHGRLKLVFLAGKFFVEQQALSDMVAAATIPARPPCPVADSRLDSTSVQPEPTAEPPGSFSTERKRLALAQAQMSVRQLKRPSKPTSPEATDHRVVPIGRNNSSSPR
jgi:hypothetical protein